jgi:hypothetical protein
MTRYLKFAFTGTSVLTPDYPDDLAPIPGPLIAVMPGARRVRPSSFRTNQINAQFAFVTFPIGHLDVTQGDRSSRDADHRHPDLRNPVRGFSFLEYENLTIDPPPLDTYLTFDSSPMTTFPTRHTTGARWIARWRDFAGQGFPYIEPNAVTSDIDAVRVIMPGGYVSAGFDHEPIARVSFDYGPRPETRAFAQEIVVTMAFDDSVESVSLLASSLSDGTPLEPSRLTFKWYDKQEMKLLFGNGSLAAIQSVLNGSFAGQDHQGDFDFEFEVTYEIVTCQEDENGRLPLPRVMNNEILRVPCIASMVSGPTNTFTTTASSRQPAVAAIRESGPMRRRLGRNRS